MKKLITLLLILGTLLISNSLLAQTKTPYEIKKGALALQFFKDLGINPSVIKKYSDTGEIGALFFLGNISQKLRTEKGALLMFKYEQDLKNIEKLKNATDYKKDEQKRLAEQRNKEVELKKQRELEDQEKEKKEKEQHQRDLANLEEQRQEDYKNSDYYKLSNEIKTEYDGWAIKGEFEKTADYESRINNEAKQMFSKICFQVVYDKIEAYDSTNINVTYYYLTINLEEYDADKEQFNATLAEGNSQKFLAQANIYVPINEAQSFKKTIQQDYDHEVIYTVNATDWCFANNNLMPKKLTIKQGSNEDKTYTLIPQLGENENVIFKATDLGIENLNTTFNYNQDYLIGLENSKKEEDQELFNKFVESARSNYASNYDTIDIKSLSTTDLSTFKYTNGQRIKDYENALAIKEDETIRQKLNECKKIEEELKTTIRSLNTRSNR
ncbi:MAG TPA: hypothetical protein VIV55_13335 [Flavobacterium sp.]